MREKKRPSMCKRRGGDKLQNVRLPLARELVILERTPTGIARQEP